MMMRYSYKCNSALCNRKAQNQGPGGAAATINLSKLNNSINQLLSVPNPSAVAFNITVPFGPSVPPNSTVAMNFQASFTPFNNVFNPTVNYPVPAAAPNLTVTQAQIVQSIEPATTHLARFRAIVVNNNPTPTPDEIVPVMAAPSFHIAMYKSLQELSMDYFIPNLHLIPQNSVTILKTNQKFIESFLAGANYEMGRELLWREYPTDQRGTYFKHFWSGNDTGLSFNQSLDITPIHTWLSTSALGTHSARPGSPTDNVVLTIRGDFLKKFPNAVIYAAKAKWPNIQGTTTPDYSKPRIEDTSVDHLYPIFTAKVDPDITFLGFNIGTAEAKGNKESTPKVPGWFFVFQERPGELRFGIDKPLPDSPPFPPTWQDLTWGMVTTSQHSNYLSLVTTNAIDLIGNKRLPDGTLNPQETNWAEDSAAMAMILNQNPVKVLIHANEMINDPQP